MIFYIKAAAGLQLKANQPPVRSACATTPEGGDPSKKSMTSRMRSCRFLVDDEEYLKSDM